MSYILDSLKKSDQERKRGTVPDLNSVHFEKERKGHRKQALWPFLLLGVLLLNSGILIVWLQPWQQEEVSEAAPPDSSQTMGTSVVPKKQAAFEAAEGTAIERDEAPVPFSSQVVAPVQRRVAAVRPHEPDGSTVSESPPPALTSSPNQGTEAGEPEKGTVAFPVADAGDAEYGLQTHAEPADTEGEQAGTTSTGNDRTEAGQQAKTTEQTSPEAGGTGDGRAGKEQSPKESGKPARLAAHHPGAHGVEAETLPEANQLPGSVQRKLPEIHISAHFFSKKPESRLVSVNGRIMREGQDNEGLEVEEITPSGVVFSFDGKKFFQKVF